MSRARRIVNIAAIVVGGSVYVAYAYWRHRGNVRDTIRARILALGINRDELIRHEMLLPRENVESEP